MSWKDYIALRSDHVCISKMYSHSPLLFKVYHVNKLYNGYNGYATVIVVHWWSTTDGCYEVVQHAEQIVPHPNIQTCQVSRPSYYYIYWYLMYINPTQVICKQTWQKVHTTPKSAYINHNVHKQSIMSPSCWLEKNSGGKHNCPSLIAINSDKDPALIIWMSDKPLKCQHSNDKYLICSGLLNISDNDQLCRSQQNKALVPKNDIYLPNITQ